MVWLKRVELPTWPCKAAMNSGRVAWFSISSGFASESASTLPEESMTVTRASAASAACWVICRSDAGGASATREANIRVFCRNEVSIWPRSIPTQA